MTLAAITKNAVSTVKQKSPVILTGFAVAGVVSTAVLAVRATPEAALRISEAEIDGNTVKKLSFLDKVLLVWPLYVPTALTGGVTIAAIIGAQSINARRQAAIIGAFTLTESAFQEYKDQVVETIGKGKEQKIRDEIVQNQVTENPPAGTIVINGDNVLCLDTYTGRYFSSTMEKIRAAQNDFNEMLEGDMYLSANEFYHLLGLEGVVVGEQVGFAPENRMKLDFSTVLTPDGRPCLAVSFRALPRQDYTAMFQ